MFRRAQSPTLDRAGRQLRGTKRYLDYQVSGDYHFCVQKDGLNSPLVKQLGWGIHHDRESKIAAYGVETDAYRELSARKNLKIVAGVRSQSAWR